MENILTGQRGTQSTPVATIPMPASSSATTTAAPVSVVESSVSPSTPIIAPRRTPSKQSRVMAKTFAQSAYDKLGYTIACLAGLVLAIGLWIAGGYFTLQAVRSITTINTSLWWWSLPLAITAVELWLMPKRGVAPASIIIFLVVLALDILTSWHGLTTTLSGRMLPLGAGWQIPSTGMTLHGIAIIISFVFAFAPEKMARWATRELWELWA